MGNQRSSSGEEFVVAFTVMNSLKFFRVGGFHKRRTYKSFTVAKFHINASVLFDMFTFSVYLKPGRWKPIDFRYAKGLL